MNCRSLLLPLLPVGREFRPREGAVLVGVGPGVALEILLLPPGGLLFLGEGPGGNELAEGLPVVGQPLGLPGTGGQVVPFVRGPAGEVRTIRLPKPFKISSLTFCL